MKIIILIFLIMTILGPILVLWTNKIDFTADWRTANRASAHIAPNPQSHPEAIIQVYSARAFNWRGIFAVHVWIALKNKNEKIYTVYQSIGWRLYRGLPPVVISKDEPDRYWFNQYPKVVYEIRGIEAEKLIPKIDAAAKNYPYRNDYIIWPGPNSNTFPAFIGRQVPEFKLAMPPNSIGKDYLGNHFFSVAPSGTGFQISIYGVFGVLIAWREGLEINIGSLVYGINPRILGISLPGIGEISFLPTK